MYFNSVMTKKLTLYANSFKCVVCFVANFGECFIFLEKESAMMGRVVYEY